MDHPCERCCSRCLQKLCTRGIPIFASLAHADLEKIASLTVHREYGKGDVILEEGNRQDGVAILNEGSVKASKYTADGREQILYVFSEGDFFGEQNLLFDRPAFYSVTALEPVKLCLIRKQDFQTLLHANPQIAVTIIGELGWRLSHLENAVQNMGVRSLEVRIHTVLLELADKYGSRHKGGVLLRLPLSREGLANYIGVARETLSRKLGQMEEDGVIQTVNNKTIWIKDLSLLNVADAPQK